MRKLVALSLLAGLLPSVVMAEGNHPMAGCGLGYLLFAKDDNSQGIQILGATTNGTFGNQTFGITSGTSGCTKDGKIAKNKVAELYAEVNFKELSRDMAAGQGEYLTTFASVLGIKEGYRPAFFQLVREKYKVLLPSAETTSVQMLETLQLQLTAHPEILG